MYWVNTALVALHFSRRTFKTNSLSFTLKENADMSISSLVSPRFLRRSSDTLEDSALRAVAAKFDGKGLVKRGKMAVVNNDGDKILQKETHLEICRDGNQVQAAFYTDNNKSFCFGLLSLQKCHASISEQDLRSIEIKLDTDDKPLAEESQGIILRARSPSDAKEWLIALTPP